jgi:hypothetical protein
MSYVDLQAIATHLRLCDDDVVAAEPLPERDAYRIRFRLGGSIILTGHDLARSGCFNTVANSIRRAMEQR